MGRVEESATQSVDQSALNRKADRTELHDPVTIAPGSDPALVLNGQVLKLTLPPQVDITRADAVATLPDIATAEAGVAYVVANDGAYMLNGAGDALLRIADLTIQDASRTHYFPSYEGAGGGNGAVIPALDTIVIGGTGNEAGSWLNISGSDAAFATNSLNFRRLTGDEAGLKEWDAAETVPAGEFRTAGAEIYYSLQASTNIPPTTDAGSNWRNVSPATTDAYSIASDGFADRSGDWATFTNNVGFNEIYALRMLDAGTFDFNQDGNPLTVDADDVIIYLYDRWSVYGSASVLADKAVNEGVVYTVENHLPESGELWFKTTSGEKESIQFQTASAAITFRARFENRQVAFAPNAPVTLEGTAWRAKRDGNLITLFSVGSEVNILTTTDEVTLIDVDGVNGTLYQFATGETWGQLKAKYSRLIFTGNSSRSGSPQIRSWSKIVDLGDQAGAFSQSGYRLDMINAEGVHIYVDTPNDSSTGLRYRQSGGDAPTDGRMQFKVVAVLKQGTDEFVAKDDLLAAERGWVKLANTPTGASGTGYHNAGDIQTVITGADGDQIAVTYGSGSREIMTFLDGVASTQRGGDIQRAKVLPSGQVQLSNSNGGTGYGDIWVKPAALTAHLDAIEVDRTGLADGDILIYDQAGDRLVRGDKGLTEERVLELIEQFKGAYKDYASPADIPDNHIGRSGGKLYSKDQDSDQPDLLRIQQ